MVRIITILVLLQSDSHFLQNGRLIWAICGTGFFLDVLWGEAFGLFASSLQREFGNIAAAFTAGNTAGAFIWGILVDVVGSLPI